MTLVIRRILPKDLGSVNTLLCKAFQIPLTNTVQESFLHQTNCYCYVATDNHEIIGTATLYVIQKTNRKAGLIEDLVIAPKAQGKGVGKALLEMLVQQSQKIGCYKTMLNSNEQNVEFYQKNGFNAKEIQMVIKH